MSTALLILWVISVLLMAYFVGSMVCTIHFNRKFNECARLNNAQERLECMKLAHEDTKDTFVLGGFWPATLSRWNVDYLAQVKGKSQ